jgi:hypothetical protein
MFKKKIKTLITLLVFCSLMLSSCGDSPEGLLDLGYEAFISEQYSDALLYANASIELLPTKDAFIFKSQVEYAMDDKAAANQTLVKFDELYPEDSEDDLLSAVYTSSDSGDCDQIQTYLETVLSSEYISTECESFWALVEESDDFSYFRDSCSTQYNALLNTKTACPDELLGGCKENRTKFIKKAIGPELWMNHNDTVSFNDNSYIINMILRAAPLPAPIKAAVAAVILVRKTEIKAKNKECGVVLHWLWINFPSATFWVTTQK